MKSGLGETEASECLLEPGDAAFIHGEFDEFDTRTRRSRWKRREIGDSRARLPAKFVEHDDQRTLSVNCDAACRTCPETIIENFER